MPDWDIDEEEAEEEEQEDPTVPNRHGYTKVAVRSRRSVVASMKSRYLRTQRPKKRGRKKKV